MNHRLTARAGALSLVGLLLFTVIAVGQVPAVVRTTTGTPVKGTLDELDKTSRLVVDIPPHIGPASVFDIPIDAVQQITLDFPRVIVETAERVIIGPWSMFTGIPEKMTLQQGFTAVPLITTGLRAIALNGHPLHEVPREWLGDGFLTRPRVLAKSIPISTSVGSSSTTTVTDPSLFLPSETPIDDLFPTYPVEADAQQELPWWVVLIGVGAIALIALLSVGGTSSSS